MTEVRTTTFREMVVSPEGELDQTNAEEIFNALCTSESPSVVLDLRAVTFLDSSMVGGCIRASVHLESTGQRFRIINAQSTVRRVFEITGLAEMLDTGD